MTADYEPKVNEKRTVIAAITETGKLFYSIHHHATDSKLMLHFVTNTMYELGNEGFATYGWIGDNASW